MHIGKADIRGIIFDMDGTLLDSMPEWKMAAESFLGSCGIIPDSDDFDCFMKSPAFEVGAYLKERYGLSGTAEELAAEIDTVIAEAYQYRIQPKPHVPELLDFLKAQGVKMAVATASDRSLAEVAFQRTGILPYLEGIISCADIGVGKTQPDVYYEAMKLLKTTKENTAVMEDALYAVRTAKNAGFFVIGVKDESMIDDEPEIRNTAGLYIEDAAEIYMKGSCQNEKA